MKVYWAYLVYLVRHKWFVFLECCKLSIPFLGLVHDLSKFSRAEFPLAAKRYCGTEEQQREVRNSYKHTWLHHQRHNAHHWQYWVVYIPTPGYYLESFAAQEHDSWSRWMKYLFGKSYSREDGSRLIPSSLVHRWKRQMMTQYVDLPDGEAESDRDEAREFLALFDQAKICLPMPSRYRREMLADWRGASHTHGNSDVRTFYRNNYDRMLLHPDTRKWLDGQFGLCPTEDLPKT